MGNVEPKKSESNFPWKEVLTLLGVIIAAYIGYLGVRSQIEIPIQATQTAEAKLTLAALTAVSLSVTPSPFPTTDLALATDTLTTMVVTQPPTASAIPEHTQLTVAAWDALDRNDYIAAASTAQVCIDKFEGVATQEHDTLIANSSPPPPLGPITDEEKRLIDSRGTLNDVATCYFILGQALEQLNRIEEAKAAYSGAQKFPYARTWDPTNHGVWSPAEAASDRLNKLP